MKISYSTYPALKIMSPEKFKEFEKSNGFINTWRSALNEKSEQPASKEFFDKYRNDVLNGKLRVPVYIPTASFTEALEKWWTEETFESIREIPTREIFDRDMAFLISKRGTDMLLVGRVISDIEMEISFVLATGIVFVVRFNDNKENQTQEITDGFFDCPNGNTAMLTEVIRTFIQLAAFMKFAPVEIDVIPGNSKTKSYIYGCKVRNEGDIDVTILNTNWFKEIIRTEGFSVKGHLRFQRCKDQFGQWTHKLIWIEAFEKHGYHRKAKLQMSL